MNQFTAKDTVIVVIGPEDADRFKDYFENHDLTFYGLPDKTQEVLKLYGQKVQLFKLGRMPTQMLIDKSGMLRFVHYGHSMTDIPKNEEILKLIDSL